MLNLITVYIIIGAIFGVFAETVASWARKHGHKIEHLDNVDRVLIVFLWPLGALVFFDAYWKEKNKDK
tara:strand:+ start:2041 stop:2244 length:204 start_codon:yes stop_codon:yes gene_type:complete